MSGYDVVETIGGESFQTNLRIAYGQSRELERRIRADLNWTIFRRRSVTADAIW